MRTEHPFHMHDAIYAQPGSLRLVGRGNGDAIAQAAERLRALDHVLVTGIGTSWHAALVGELMLAQVGRLGYRARAVHAFDLASYGPAAGARPRRARINKNQPTTPTSN
jgi:glucosamine 6-phosphate synthetase-like amidotransferase/phosphosugar isomerase protein